MKKIFRIFTLLCLIALFVVSCGDEGNGRGNGANADLAFYSAESNYYGAAINWDGFRVGDADSYRLWLDDESLTNNINGDGTYIMLDLNTPLTNVNEIKSGLYKPDNGSASPLTFSPGEWITNANNERVVVGSYIAVITNGKQVTLPITNGNINVNNGNRSYSITGYVIANNTQYTISYNGNIPITDYWSPLPETLTNGELWYNGNLFNNGLNVYTIRLWDDNNNTSRFTGSGDAMQVDVYMRLTDSETKLKDGRYPILVDQAVAYSAIEGFYENGTDYGAWYYTADYFTIKSGSVDIKWLTGSTYNIKFDFKDDFYNLSFNGTYEGELAFINKTTEPFAVRPAVKRLAAPNKASRSNVSRSRENSPQRDLELRKSNPARQPSLQR